MTALMLGDGALLALPSVRVQARIVPWRRIYDPEHWRSIPPHITVAYPFVPRGDWDAVRPAFAQRLQAFRPFWISLAELGVFESPQAVLWLRADDGGELIRIHATLAEMFPAHVPEDTLGFIPHLTLGFFNSLEALAQARNTIAAAWRPVRFRVKSLCYAVLHEDRTWRTCDVLPLGDMRSDRTDDCGNG